jgi:hypothetical protein
LASSTKKREGKVRSSSSLRLILDLIISFIIIFTIIIGIAVPSPRVFHSGRRKMRVDRGLVGLKTHGSVHFTLALLQVRKPLTHLLMRLVDKGVVGSAHGYESLEVLDKNVLFLPPASSSSGGLRSN